MSTFLYGGLRTPIGKYRGRLSEYTGVQLGAQALGNLVKRHPGAAKVDGIVMGMTVQAGQGSNPARVAAHRAGLNMELPAITLNNACLAGIDCVIDATRRIAFNEGNGYLVGGMHSATRAPFVENEGEERMLAIVRDGLICAIGNEHVGLFSERRNRELGISRERQDEWSFESQMRAARADFVASGELVPLQTQDGLLDRDEAVRPQTTMDALRNLKPAFIPDGTITAGNAPPLADASCVAVVGNRAFADTVEREPLVRIVDWAHCAGPDWTLHDQPAKAVFKLLDKQGLRPSDIDLYEINEAFAGIVINAVDTLKIPASIVNVNGGAIAFGHPDAATSTRQLLTLSLELNKRKLRRGVATLCGAGGQGIAILVETVGGAG
jgi:acetyl-CoA C-acetyltransferase